MKRITLFLSLFATLFISVTALATGTVSSSLNVNVVVDSSCQISTNNITFPDYAPLGANATSPDDNNAGSVIITCTSGTGGTIQMGHGTGWNGTQWRMLNAVTSTYLGYTIYQDASHTTIWDSEMTIAPAPSTSPRTYPIYARIAAGLDVASGTYTDTVNVTFNF